MNSARRLCIFLASWSPPEAFSQQYFKLLDKPEKSYSKKSPGLQTATYSSAILPWNR